MQDYVSVCQEMASPLPTKLWRVFSLGLHVGHQHHCKHLSPKSLASLNACMFTHMCNLGHDSFHTSAAQLIATTESWLYTTVIQLCKQSDSLSQNDGRSHQIVMRIHLNYAKQSSIRLWGQVGFHLCTLFVVPWLPTIPEKKSAPKSKQGLGQGMTSHSPLPKQIYPEPGLRNPSEWRSHMVQSMLCGSPWSCLHTSLLGSGSCERSLPTIRLYYIPGQAPCQRRAAAVLATFTKAAEKQQLMVLPQTLQMSCLQPAYLSESQLWCHPR